jgi:hypothetical protein
MHSSFMNFRSFAAGSIVVVAMFSLAKAARAEPVNDPFPEKIAKGDVRVELKPVASGLVSPVLLLTAPQDAKRLFVVDQVGLVRVIEGGALRAEPFLDVRERLVKLNLEFDERGFLGLAFDPEFAKPGARGERRVLHVHERASGGARGFPDRPWQRKAGLPECRGRRGG